MRNFNGSSDLIGLASLSMLAATTPVTVAAWIKTSAATGAILSSDTGASAQRIIQFKVSTNKLQAILFNVNAGQTWTSLADVNDGNWHHVAFVYDGTTGYMYIDGALDSSSAKTVTRALNGRPARIGAHLAGITQQLFTGTIGEVVALSRGCSAGEISSLAHGLRASHVAPDHYWPLWGADDPEPDLGGAAHQTGSLTGTTAVAGGKVARGLVTITA